MFHVNPLAEDSHEIASLIFPESNEKYLLMSSAAVVIGALRVKVHFYGMQLFHF